MPSTVVAHIRYDPSSATLTVVFVSGMVYKYKDVPEEVYASMKSSGSKGKYLNQYIKGKYEFEKVDG
jgi:hypothetical protein